MVVSTQHEPFEATETSDARPSGSVDDEPPLWCRALGEPGLYASDDEETLLVTAGKPLALLIYVALAPRRRSSRDHLAELLWRGSSLPDARHSLRQALYRLRSAAGGRDLIESHGARLELGPAIDFDFEQGEAALASGSVRKAYGLLAGDFLQGFSVPESHEFETWSESQRTRFRDEWESAAGELAKRSLASGEPDTALEIAERLAAHRPFDDEPIRLTLAALAEQGRHAAAIARFHAYVDLLRSEEEGEPGAALRTYAEELQKYVADGSAMRTTDLPFVGRAQEWGRLEARWEAARDGEGSTVLLEGSAGLGKTRLLAELERRVRAGGALALTAKSYEIERTVPYAAVADALSRDMESRDLERLGPAWLSELSRLLPELRERFPDLPTPSDLGSSPAAKRRLHQAIVRCVEALSEESPVLVSIDDVHWTDSSSLEVLHLLSHRLAEARVLMVASYRPAELSPAARRFIRSLPSQGPDTLLTLGPLDEPDVEDLLEKLGDFGAGSVARVVSHHLHTLSGGNPLFLSELLEALDRDRVLRVRNGQWHLGARARLEDLPHTLVKLLSDRVDTLDPLMRACVEALAVGAGGTSVDVLGRVFNISAPRVELTLAVLREERLARSLDSGEHELMHDELRRVVYQGIPDERRRLLHLEVGSALEAQGLERRPGGAARLAHHFDQAGDAERAHRYAVLAAGEAEALDALDARRALLEVATSHSPRALPPGVGLEATEKEDRPDGSWGAWRDLLVRRPLVTGAVGVVFIALGVLGSLFFGRGSRPALTDFRQGTLYLAPADGGRADATHRLIWSTDVEVPGRVEELDTYPGELPPRIRHRWVPQEGETHAKIFRIDGSESVQLTFGQTDDLTGGWSPDGRWFAFYRGWKESPERFSYNVMLLDRTGNVRQVTRTPDQDVFQDWAPTGTQILFARLAGGESRLYLSDADGGSPVDLTERYGLPRVKVDAAFSPVGKRIGLLYPDTGANRAALYILDLERSALRPLAWPHPPDDAAVAPLVWSPDGRWILVGASGERGRALWARAVDGSAGPFLISDLPPDLRPTYWAGAKPRFAATLEVEPSAEALTLRAGEGRRVPVSVRGPDGGALSVPIRWSVLDTTIARVDGLGFLTARSPGTTLLFATAGGLLGDTLPVNISFAGIDTLFVEGWRGGLDPDVWVPFGNPPPRIVAGVFPGGAPGFLNNGDFNHLSGATSRSRFDPSAKGFTIEAEALGSFVGDGQDWHLGFMADSTPSPGSDLAGDQFEMVGLMGPTPQRAEQFWTGCGSRGERVSSRLDQGVHRVAIQVRPDTVVECFMDGTLLARGRVAADRWSDALAIVLAGRSENTRIYHGRVVVTRGLRY